MKWKDEIKKENQLQKNIDGFINDVEEITKRLEEMTRFTPIPPKVGRELKKVFRALELTEESLRDMLDEAFEEWFP